MTDTDVQVPAPRWHFRSMREDDFNFVIATWIRGARYHGVMKMVPKEFYFSRMQQLIIRLCEECVTIVACDPQDHGLIYGYLNGLPPDIHESRSGQLLQLRVPIVNWMFVRVDFRGNGLATELLKELGYARGKGLKFTMPFENSRFYLPRFPDAQFDPFWLMGLKDKSYVED